MALNRNGLGVLRIVSKRICANGDMAFGTSNSHATITAIGIPNVSADMLKQLVEERIISAQFATPFSE